MQVTVINEVLPKPVTLEPGVVFTSTQGKAYMVIALDTNVLAVNQCNAVFALRLDDGEVCRWSNGSDAGSSKIIGFAEEVTVVVR
jgi:hypothetical protein